MKHSAGDRHILRGNGGGDDVDVVNVYIERDCVSRSWWIGHGICISDLQSDSYWKTENVLFADNRIIGWLEMTM